MVILEPDIALGLKKMQREFPDQPFEQLVNTVLRRGLQKDMSRPSQKFRVKAHSIGLRTDMNFDNIEESLDILEGVRRR